MKSFSQLRPDESQELDQLLSEVCQTVVKGGAENQYGKVNILLQTYISKATLESVSLISDMGYVAQVRCCWCILVRMCYQVKVTYQKELCHLYCLNWDMFLTGFLLLCMNLIKPLVLFIHRR